jgi:rubrerythrin
VRTKKKFKGEKTGVIEVMILFKCKFCGLVWDINCKKCPSCRSPNAMECKEMSEAMQEKRQTKLLDDRRRIL